MASLVAGGLLATRVGFRGGWGEASCCLFFFFWFLLGSSSLFFFFGGGFSWVPLVFGCSSSFLCINLMKVDLTSLASAKTNDDMAP